jgi:hypothetical protein
MIYKKLEEHTSMPALIPARDSPVRILSLENNYSLNFLKEVK